MGLYIDPQAMATTMSMVEKPFEEYQAVKAKRAAAIAQAQQQAQQQANFEQQMAQRGSQFSATEADKASTLSEKKSEFKPFGSLVNSMGQSVSVNQVTGITAGKPGYFGYGKDGHPLTRQEFALVHGHGALPENQGTTTQQVAPSAMPKIPGAVSATIPQTSPSAASFGQQPMSQAPTTPTLASLQQGDVSSYGATPSTTASSVPFAGGTAIPSGITPDQAGGATTGSGLPPVSGVSASNAFSQLQRPIASPNLQAQSGATPASGDNLPSTQQSLASLSQPVQQPQQMQPTDASLYGGQTDESEPDVQQLPESTKYQKQGIDPTTGQNIYMPTSASQNIIMNKDAAIKGSQNITPVMMDAFTGYRSALGHAKLAAESAHYSTMGDSPAKQQLGTQMAKMFGAKQMLQEYSGSQIRKGIPGKSPPQAQILDYVRGNFPYISKMNTAFLPSNVRNAGMAYGDLMSSYMAVEEELGYGHDTGSALQAKQQQAAKLVDEMHNFNINDYNTDSSMSLSSFQGKTPQQKLAMYNNLSPDQQKIIYKQTGGQL